MNTVSLTRDDLQLVGDDVSQIHATVTAQEGRKVKIDDRWVFDFASCNYLGFDLETSVIDPVVSAIRKWGTHPSWTRAVASPGLYEELEHGLANLVGADATLVFPTITMLHAGVLPILVGSEGIIFKDSTVHRSVQDACRLASSYGARVVKCEHNNPSDLDQKLAEEPADRQKIIVLDGVHSMFGAYPDLPQYVEVARKHGAVLYIDDAHGIGVLGSNPSEEHPYGRGGSGIAKRFDLDYRRDGIIYVAGLSKAFSSFGGFITCSQTWKKKFKAAAPFIFSGPIPTASLALGLEMLSLNKEIGDARREKLYRLSLALVNGARTCGFEVLNEDGLPIISVVVGATENVVKACEVLWKHRILVTPAVPPLVSSRRGLIRFSMTSANELEEVEAAIAALKEVYSSIHSGAN